MDIIALLLTYTQAFILTILVETLFFLCAGPRDRKFLLLVVLINLFTNIALNLCLMTTQLTGIIPGRSRMWHYAILALMEAAVVITEYRAYSAFLARKDMALFIKTLLANAVSFSAGIALGYVIGVTGFQIL